MKTPKILVRKIKNSPVKFKIKLKLILLIIITIFCLFLAIPYSLYSVISYTYQDQIYSIDDKLPETRVAIVFGAALQNYNKEPSPILQDRILTAVDLYKKGIIKKIIMSGDNRYLDYNEPQIMVDFAKKNGVSEFDLQPDYAGRRTYDTCLRAKEIFGVNQAILISQNFHLPRALYTCNALGLEAIGVSADRNIYQDYTGFEVREFGATLLAFWEINIKAPDDVVLGEKINF